MGVGIRGTEGSSIQVHFANSLILFVSVLIGGALLLILLLRRR